MSTATVHVARPLTVVPDDQKVAFATALRMKAASAGRSLSALPRRFRDGIRRGMEFLHLDGVYDWLAGAGHWVLERSGPVREAVRTIGAIPLAALAITTKTGQAVINTAVKMVTKPLGWLYRKFRNSIEWTLNHLGNPGRQAQAHFATSMNKMEAKVGGWYAKADARGKRWFDPESLHISAIRELSTTVVAVRFIRRYTTGWVRYSLYALSLLLPVSGSSRKALDKARKSEHRPVDPAATERIREAVPTPIRDKVEMATQIVEGAMPHVQSEEELVVETAGAETSITTIPRPQQTYPAKQQGKKRNK